jgi:uncharacterized protein with HEPN domain
METDVRAYLDDIRRAAAAILDFTRGKTFADYHSDDLLRSATERKFEIIGEALNRLRKDAPELLARIHEHRSIISFRNILVHGYDRIDDQIVWGIVEQELTTLLNDVEDLLKQTASKDT